MAKGEEESIGESGESILEGPEFQLVKISPFGRNDRAGAPNDKTRGVEALREPK